MDKKKRRLKHILTSKILNKNRKRLLYWYIGLMDGEGNFQTFPKKRPGGYYGVGYGIHLSMHIRDISLIRYLKRELKLPGIIYIYSHRDEVRLSITRLKDIKQVINKIFNKYPLINKKNRHNLARLKYGVFNQINRFNTKDEYIQFYNNYELWKNIIAETNYKNLNIHKKEFAYWLCGFIEAEGCFIYNKKFSIEQADKQLLALIKEKFNWSPNLYEKDRRNKRPNSIVTWSICITSIRDINTLNVFLSNPINLGLKGYKYKQYISWKYRK